MFNKYNFISSCVTILGCQPIIEDTVMPDILIVLNANDLVITVFILAILCETKDAKKKVLMLSTIIIKLKLVQNYLQALSDS